MAFFSPTTASALSLFVLFCVALLPLAQLTLAGRPTPAAATNHSKSDKAQLSVPSKTQQTDQVANSGGKQPLRQEQTRSTASDRKQTECFGLQEGTPALIPGYGVRGIFVGGGVPAATGGGSVPVAGMGGGGIPAATGDGSVPAAGMGGVGGIPAATGGGIPAATGDGSVPAAGTGGGGGIPAATGGGSVPADGMGGGGGGIPAATGDGSVPAAGTGGGGGSVPADGMDGGSVPAAGMRYLPGNDDTFVPNPGFEVPNPAYGGATP